MAAMMAIAAIPAIAVCETQAHNVTKTGSSTLPLASNVAKKSPAVGTATGIASNVAAVALATGQAPDLVNTLVQQLRITPEQAAGGAGSIFSMAKQGMKSADFAKVSNAVPGMEQLLALASSHAAPRSGMSGLMGLASSALGKSGGSLGNLALLAGSFQSLGLNSGMIGQFIPVILQSVQSQAGSATMGMLQSALAH
jgi:hypothetical protein